MCKNSGPGWTYALVTLELKFEAVCLAWQFRHWSAEREREKGSDRHGTEGTVELGVEVVGLTTE